MSTPRYDQYTIELLRRVLDEAWGTLSPSKRMSICRSDMAALILEAASRGERDPDILREAALGAREFVLDVA